jgi:hypothetical protein
LPGIAFADESVEIWKRRTRHEESIVFAEEIGFVGGALAQQADHELRGLGGAGIGEGVLPVGQAIVGADESADECGQRHGRAHGIHQREADALDEGTRVFDGADGLAIETPFFAASGFEVLVGHSAALVLSFLL